MAPDRLVALQVCGLRSLRRVELSLGDLKVLIGGNGAGKSSLIEAFELLRRAADPEAYLSGAFARTHGGLRSLLGQESSELSLSVRIESQRARGPSHPAPEQAPTEHPPSEAPIEYSFAIGFEGNSTVISRERLDLHVHLGQEPLHAIQRDRGQCRVFDVTEKKLVPMSVGPHQLVLTSFGRVAQPAIARVLDVLSRISVNVPFDVRALWVSEDKRGRSAVRDLANVDHASRLERLGGNLANCLHTLKETRPQGDWLRILEVARAGLGTDLVDIRTPPVQRNQIELQLLFSTLPRPVPASALSDGQLSYLALLALAELSGDASVVVIDEPEAHLHPELMVRAAGILEDLASRTPVVIATQSDRFLDALSEPSRSVLLCELDEKRETRILRPDPEVLARWLERYVGLGTVRAQGYERALFSEDATQDGRKPRESEP